MQVLSEYGMVHVKSEKEYGNTKDYCIQFNPSWAYLPHDLSKAVSVHQGTFQKMY